MADLLDPDRARLVLADYLEVVAKFDVLEHRRSILVALCECSELLAGVCERCAVCEWRDIVLTDPIMLVDNRSGGHHNDEGRRVVTVRGLPETTRVLRVDG